MGVRFPLTVQAKKQDLKKFLLFFETTNGRLLPSTSGFRSIPAALSGTHTAGLRSGVNEQGVGDTESLCEVAGGERDRDP